MIKVQFFSHNLSLSKSNRELSIVNHIVTVSSIYRYIPTTYMEVKIKYVLSKLFTVHFLSGIFTPQMGKTRLT